MSVIGLGGIVLSGMERARASRLVAEAVERGVNYFDVAPTYGDAELNLGPALRPYRREVFLACKTTQRTREGAAEELSQSLSRLETDYVDLYQLHGMVSVEEDVDPAFAPGGAMEVFREAKRDGRVRHLGFSAHSHEAALTAMDRYAFDSVLFPVNFACMLSGSFGPPVLEAAQEKGMTVLALKAMARQRWPKGDPMRTTYAKCWYQPATERHEAQLALRFALAQPVAAALPPGEEPLFRLALDIATQDVSPLSKEEVSELQRLAGTLDPIYAASTADSGD